MNKHTARALGKRGHARLLTVRIDQRCLSHRRRGSIIGKRRDSKETEGEKSDGDGKFGHD